MKLRLLAAGMMLSGCFSTSDEQFWEQYYWLKSDEYAACEEQLEEKKKEREAYEKKRAAFEKLYSKYDADAAMAEYNKKIAEYEAAKTAGELAVWPGKPPPPNKEIAIVASVGFGPKLPEDGCIKPPEGWSAG